ncbi:transposase [Aneurinibacillus sp. Ricciae_BoGa-3]|nr:transposase [Aneurinibacillus sp. Ricciae_BoGa-3]WCK52513.1 transposase [Aneurinibacillus sp. Ricciae_BoGa-3]
MKDARVIAQLMKDGRYSEPQIPQGIYAELRVGMNIREQLSKDLLQVKGRIHNWLDRYFPEFLTVFKDWEGKTRNLHFVIFLYQRILYSEMQKVLSKCGELRLNVLLG